MKYRKKPVVIEAFPLTDDPDMEAPAWFTQAVADETVWVDRALKDARYRLLKERCMRSWGTTLSGA